MTSNDDEPGTTTSPNFQEGDINVSQADRDSDSPDYSNHLPCSGLVLGLESRGGTGPGKGCSGAAGPVDQDQRNAERRPGGDEATAQVRTVGPEEPSSYPST